MTASTMLNEYATEAQLRDLAAICNAQLAHLRRALNGAFELGELVSQPRAAVAHKPVSIHLVVSDAVWGMTGTHLSLSLSLSLSRLPSVSRPPLTRLCPELWREAECYASG